MANYNLVIDTSNFKPFDMSLDYQVLRDYRDTYRRYQDAMNKIAEEDGQYILPDTPENEAYKAVMDKYREDKAAAMEDFSKGMNIRNARRLQDIHRRHFEEMVPINKAIEAYNKDADKITALGPDVIVANRNNRKVSDYYGGVNPGIQYRSNKSIQEAAAGIMQGIDNALMQAPQMAGNIAKQYFILKSQGVNGADALQSILQYNPQLNNAEGAQDVGVLMNALDSIYRQYAFEEGTPENSQVWQNVVNGAIRGIQAPKYQLQTNHDFESAAANSARIKQEQRYEDMHNESLLEQGLKRAEAVAEGYVPVQGTENEFTYDPSAAVKPTGTKPTTVTPHIEYGGRSYAVKPHGSGQNITYEIYDVEDGSIVTDPTLHQKLESLFKGEGKQADIEETRRLLERITGRTTNSSRREAGGGSPAPADTTVVTQNEPLRNQGGRRGNGVDGSSLEE